MNPCSLESYEARRTAAARLWRLAFGLDVLDRSGREEVGRVGVAGEAAVAWGAWEEEDDREDDAVPDGGSAAACTSVAVAGRAAVEAKTVDSTGWGQDAAGSAASKVVWREVTRGRRVLAVGPSSEEGGLVVSEEEAAGGATAHSWAAALERAA